MTSDRALPAPAQASESARWLNAFWICLAIVPLQAAFGEAFYKLHLGPIYLSELFVLVAWLTAAPAIVARRAFPNVPWLRWLLALSFGYLLYSLSADRELIWIVRQSSFILYASVGILSYVALSRYREGIPLDGLLKKLVWIGLGMLLFLRLPLFPPTNRDYVSTLILLIGYAAWIVRARSLGAKLLIGLTCTGLIATLNAHSSFMPGAALILMLTLFFQFPRLRPALLLLGLLAAVVGSGLNEQYSDANATWRYRYWHAVVTDSWDRGAFLLGKGFGIQYMPASAPDFEQLISQVSTVDMPMRDFQLMTVPPHNGLLTLLIYLGLPGVLLFLAPLALGFLRSMSPTAPPLLMTFTLACGGMLVLISTNQSFEFPYVAICYWLTYGGLLAALHDRPRPHTLPS